MQLFLEYLPERTDDQWIHVPPATMCVLFVLKRCQGLLDPAASQCEPLPIGFLAQQRRRETSAKDDRLRLSVNATEARSLFHAEIRSLSSDHLISSCVLPAIFVPEQNLCITGLCSVIRHLLTHLGQKEARSFLGHQHNCLSAPAEVSSWTRFCEIGLPNCLSTASKDQEPCAIPIEVAQFEAHMSQPMRVHNIRKKMAQDSAFMSRLAQQESSSEDPIHLFAASQHVFAEGPDCLLSDLLIFPMMHIVLTSVGPDTLQQHFPLTYDWYQRMRQAHKADQLFDSLFTLDKPLLLHHQVAAVPNQSLYSCDPKRHNASARAFTRQHEVDRVLDKIRLAQVEVLTSRSAIGLLSPFSLDWEALPEAIHPVGGGLPASRLGKKCDQLKNLAAAVCSMAQPNQIIVDFCSGGGHLAILLAYLLPENVVYLVENKEQSLKRAVQRVQQMGLTNCRFFQGNMDYFCGHFDIGVSLHACGPATDLVIQACVQVKASFVTCPCCYGSLQENHILSYPRSQHFLTRGILFKDFMIVGHTADQTHFTNDKHLQGSTAMDIVDSDRIHFAREAGYEDVLLLKLEPSTCTPKNNLIVATFSTSK